MLDLVCVICHEIFSATDNVYATQCGHIFHQTCISQWLNDSNTCPQCRKMCTGTNIHKLYLESAIASSENANLKVQLSTENTSRQALDLYEEVNLNLKRDLETAETNLDICQARLLYLEDEQKQAQNYLKDEIEKRKNYEKRVAELEMDKLRLTELDHSLQVEYIRVQNDLKKEVERRAIKVAELEKNKIDLEAVVERLEIANRVAQNDLELQNKRNWTTEERMAEVEKKIQKEIETREKSEKRLAQLERKQLRPKENLNNSNQHEAKEVSDLRTISNTEDKNDLTAEAVLFGMPQQPDENLESIFKQLCHTINFRPPNLKDIYRMRQPNKDDPAIILKFRSPYERSSTLKAISDHRKKVNRHLSPQDLGITCSSSKKIYMRENLSSIARALFHQARSMKRNNQLFSVYIYCGSVYVKQSANGISRKIENEEMLNAIALTSKDQTAKEIHSAFRCRSLLELT